MSETLPPLPLLDEADRAVRRGELKEALVLLRQLLERDPASEALQARVRSVESLLQPKELFAPQALLPRVGSRSFEHPPTLEQVAEALFDHGDIAGALSTYERVLLARPNHQLARERLQEIRAVAGARPKAPGRAEALPKAKDRLYEELLARIASRRRG